MKINTKESDNNMFKFNSDISELNYYCDKKFSKRSINNTSLNYYGGAFDALDPLYNYGNVIVRERQNDYFIKCLRFKENYNKDLHKELNNFMYKDVNSIIIEYLQPEKYDEIMKNYLG